MVRAVAALSFHWASALILAFHASFITVSTEALSTFRCSNVSAQYWMDVRSALTLPRSSRPVKLPASKPSS